MKPPRNEALASNIRQNAYHPIANVIIFCLEKRINFLNRGIFEVKNLQSENFVAEKFALTTETRLLEGFLRDFFYMQKDVVVCVPPLGANISGSPKIYKGEGDAKYRLIFKPMDSINNFGRGFGECGSVFCLQSIIPEESGKEKYENVFSLFYSFKTQKFLYAEHKGVVYLENKRMKALHRKTSLTIGVNSGAILSGLIKKEAVEVAKIKNIFSRGDGFVSDCFDIANGTLDGVIYSKIKAWDALPIQILLSSLSCYSSLSKEVLTDITKEVDLIAGGEIIPKSFS
jgi:fructose-1,6-bisphosphatase/inositol monophosphatase family enzyme